MKIETGTVQAGKSTIAAVTAFPEKNKPVAGPGIIESKIGIGTA